MKYRSSYIYISQTYGDDSFDGFSPVYENGSGPIKTIKKLLEKLRELRKNGDLFPVTVRFIGDYEMEQSIKLEGINDVTFESFGEKTARLIGGKILKGFKKDIYNGKECISLYIPNVENGEWHFSDLYVDGIPAKSSRYPKNSTLMGLTTEDPINKGVLNNGSKWFIAKKEDLEKIKNIEDAIISYDHFWVDEHSPIESYDRESGKLVMKYRSKYFLSVDYEKSPSSDLHYYLENVGEAFENEGEWYLDSKKGMVYYIPQKNNSLENCEIIAPTIKHFFEIEGTSEEVTIGIRINNLKMISTNGECEFKDLNSNELLACDSQSHHTAHGAIRLKNAKCCSIENCEIVCAGVYAIEIMEGCQNIRVEESKILNCGGGGIKIKGGAIKDKGSLPTENCVIRKNIIKNCCLRYAASCGVLICHSANNEISENEISHLEYSGISVGWVWGYEPSSTYGNIIRNNHIHHIGKRLSDMGGIYLLGIQSGTVVEGNIIHDINCGKYCANGIYTDEGSSYIIIRNNIVFNCASFCYQHHFGKQNTVCSNIFANAGVSLIDITKKENHNSVLLQNNILISNNTPIYSTVLGSEKNNHMLTTELVSDDNILWDISCDEPLMFIYNGEKIGFSDWQKKYGFDKNSKVQKPEPCVFEKIKGEYYNE